MTFVKHRKFLTLIKIQVLVIIRETLCIVLTRKFPVPVGSWKFLVHEGTGSSEGLPASGLNKNKP